MADKMRPKRLVWVGSSRKDLREFTKKARWTVGKALSDATVGERHSSVKALQGFGSAGVLEIVESDNGKAYRAVYTVKFTDAVYVLHAFQKKSARGGKTPAKDIELVRTRLKRAEEDHAERVANQKADAENPAG